MKHGHAKRKAKERLYYVWYGMKARCYSPNSSGYKNYGARGINVCEKWRVSYLDFRDWAFANGYDINANYGECTLERIDCNKDYEPSNCCWVSKKTQANNTRRNHFITYKGQTLTIAQWGELLDIPQDKIWSRIVTNNMPIEKALSSSENMDETIITYNGEKHNLKEWSQILNIHVQTLSSRIHKLGWDIEKAFTTPTKRRNKNAD